MNDSLKSLAIFVVVVCFLFITWFLFGLLPTECSNPYGNLSINDICDSYKIGAGQKIMSWVK